MNLLEIYKKFPEQKDCIEYLEKIRWKDKPTCPYCQSQKNHHAPAELRYFCHDCKRSYSVKVGTIFDNTRLPLQKWFLAITLILNAKKGISSRQLARDLRVTKDTSWSMQIRIREAMTETPSLLLGVVEMEKTYIGAKRLRKEAKDKDDRGNYPKNPRGRGTNKAAVVGMVERAGRVIAIKQTELKFADLENTTKAHIDFESAVLITDYYRGYIPFKYLINHQTVNHSQKQWTKGSIHTSTIESFWAILKRGILRQYHHLSDKHLNRYIKEFCFKNSNRKNQDVFNLVLTKALGV